VASCGAAGGISTVVSSWGAEGSRGAVGSNGRHGGYSCSYFLLTVADLLCFLCASWMSEMYFYTVPAAAPWMSEMYLCAVHAAALICITAR
jgi:hypothetical protein